jgi:hypothetical protein
MKKSQYKICVIYKPNMLVEKCMYRYANDANHAKNIGKLILRQMYGTKKTQHIIAVQKV